MKAPNVMEARSATQWSDGIEMLTGVDPLTSLRYVRGFHYAPGSHYQCQAKIDTPKQQKLIKNTLDSIL